MKHLIEEQLILYYYGEAEDEAFTEEHLASCDPCRAEFQELKRVLALVDTFESPARSADFENEVWRRLRPRLAGRPLFRWPVLLSPRKLGLAGSLAALLLAAFLLGRFWQGSQVPATGPPAAPMASAEVGQRVLLASIADHLERSQMVLMDLSHDDGENEIDISADQAWAQGLLAENRLYRQGALRNGEPGVAGVLDDLERILIDITNSPAKIPAAGLAEIRRRIAEQGIIFELRVVSSSLRHRQNTIARELARRSS
jgi:hypothetical protein